MQQAGIFEDFDIRERWRRLLFREENSNKYDYGHVLVIGGSQQMTGAAVLAARAALRCGAGLVTIAADKVTTQLIDRDVEEQMTLALPAWENAEEVLRSIEDFTENRHVSAIIIGPGLPQESDAFIRLFFGRSRTVPVVADAEVFTALRGHLKLLSNSPGPIVMTPHTGEFARLMENDAAPDDTKVPRFTTHHPEVVLVLKQHNTIVSAKGELYKNNSGNAGLATAGSGDVLTGVIAGLLVQAIPAYDAAKMAVYLHGLAGDLAAETKTQPGLIASDIIENLPVALRKVKALLTKDKTEQ